LRFISDFDDATKGAHHLIACCILEKKNFIIRLDDELYQALARWAGDEFRSVNGQMEWIIHQALKNSGRLPKSKPPVIQKSSKKTG